jgi:hypothetical protein
LIVIGDFQFEISRLSVCWDHFFPHLSLHICTFPTLRPLSGFPSGYQWNNLADRFNVLVRFATSRGAAVRMCSRLLQPDHPPSSPVLLIGRCCPALLPSSSRRPKLAPLICYQSMRLFTLHLRNRSVKSLLGGHDSVCQRKCNSRGRNVTFT